jgi:uncharacterized membrane protein
MEAAYLLDWANLLLRWAHVVTAIAWIGSSFYFVFLDSSLTPPSDPLLKERGVRYVSAAEWRQIDGVEVAAGAKAGKPRVKIVEPADMLAVLDSSTTVNSRAECTPQCAGVWMRRIHRFVTKV